MIFRAAAAYGAILVLMAAVPSSAKEKEASKDTVQVQTALSATDVAFKETNLGNLIADALKQTGHAQISLIPADEINSHAQIPAGKTDTGTIVNTLRYADDPSDTVVVLNLTGAQLRKVAERAVSRAPEPFDGFLQVSGLSIHYTPGQSEGKRITRVEADGSELDLEKVYKVATTRPLAGGSLGYFQIWSKKDIAEDTGVSLSKSLSTYLSTHKTINSVVEKRISTH